MGGVGIEIVKTEETKESEIKYLNVNISNSEVERNPDIVRLCADAGILEYVKPKTGHWINGHKETGALGITYTEKICSNCGWNHSLVIPKNYCPNCGAKMTESEDKE